MLRHCERYASRDDLFERISGISQQALDDFKSLTPRDCIILLPLAEFVSFKFLAIPKANLT